MYSTASLPGSGVFRRMPLLFGLVVIGGLVGWDDAKEAGESSPFSSSTVDFGIVVSDIEKSLEFYTDGLGFTEIATFDVPAEMGRDTGLSDGQPFKVHVLAAANEEGATKVKLMQFPQAPGARIDNSHIHSSYGVRYLTLFVKDFEKSLESAQKQGARPIAKGPVTLPESIAPNLQLAVVRDPDGNMIELVGPKQK